MAEQHTDRRPGPWARLLRLLGLRGRDPVADAMARQQDAETRDRAKQEWNDRRGQSIVG